MEDNLKILKLEYLSNCLFDHTQFLNLSLDDQTIFCKSIKWRRPKRNRLLDHIQILNASLHDQNIFRKSFKWRQPPTEDFLKILKLVYLSIHVLDPTHILNLTLDYQTILYKSCTSNGRWPQNIKIWISQQPL
jgi:hypothetical protein